MRRKCYQAVVLRDKCRKSRIRRNWRLTLLGLKLNCALPMSAETGVSAGEGMFAAGFVVSMAYVAVSIPRLISVEVVERPGPALGQRTMVAVVGIKAIVDVAIKTRMAVEPGAGSKEDPTNKPVGSVVAIGSAVVRGVVEVTVGAYGFRSDIDADSNLGWSYRGTAEKRNCKS